MVSRSFLQPQEFVRSKISKDNLFTHKYVHAKMFSGGVNLTPEPPDVKQCLTLHQTLCSAALKLDNAISTSSKTRSADLYYFLF